MQTLGIKALVEVHSVQQKCVCVYFLHISVELKAYLQFVISAAQLGVFLSLTV